MITKDESNICKTVIFSIENLDEFVHTIQLAQKKMEEQNYAGCKRLLDILGDFEFNLKARIHEGEPLKVEGTTYDSSL